MGCRVNERWRAVFREFSRARNRRGGVERRTPVSRDRPGGRTIRYDPRLQHPGFVVPGSFLAANLPAGGVPGAAQRDAARQARATGGYGLLRITQATNRREPRGCTAEQVCGPSPTCPRPATLKACVKPFGRSR